MSERMYLFTRFERFWHWSQAALIITLLFTGFAQLDPLGLPAHAAVAETVEAARLIASKSPVAVRGTKEVLNYSRDHSVDDGLRYVATWNAGMLISEDIQQAAMAAMTRQSARFRD